MEATMNGLNMILFEQIERINDDELKGEELEEQLKKSSAIGRIAGAITKNADLSLKAAALQMKAKEEGFCLGKAESRLLGLSETPSGEGGRP